MDFIQHNEIYPMMIQISNTFSPTYNIESETALVWSGGKVYLCGRVERKFCSDVNNSLSTSDSDLHHKPSPTVGKMDCPSQIHDI